MNQFHRPFFISLKSYKGNRGASLARKRACHPELVIVSVVELRRARVGLSLQSFLLYVPSLRGRLCDRSKWSGAEFTNSVKI
jgi:hypothetical protein